VNLAAKVLGEIKAFDAVIVLLAAGGAFSPWVQQEIGAAMAAGKLVVPILRAGIDLEMVGLAGLGSVPAEVAAGHREPLGAIEFLFADDRPLGADITVGRAIVLRA